MNRSIDIEPASYQQVVAAGSDWVVIDDDLGGIAKELRELDSRLHLRYNVGQGFYAIYAKEKGEEYLVGTYKSLDRRVTERIRYIMSGSYDFVAEGEKAEDKREKEFKAKMNEVHGEGAERLAHALRRDLGLNNNRAFISNGLPK